MIQRVLVMFVLLIVIASPRPASAQGGSGSPDIVVQGTKTGTPLEQLTSAVTIIDEAAIREMRVPTILEVLRQVEGLDVVQSGGPGGQTSLFLRGGESNHTLVVVDGVKVNDPTTGSFNIAHLTIHEIERIEVLRGSQGTLYGSEAVSGVVNIITKRGSSEERDSLTVEGGSYRTWRGALQHAGHGPVWDSSFSVSRWTSKGFSKADERNGNTEPDGYANTTFASRLGRPVGVGGKLNLTARLTDATADYDDAFPLADSPALQRDKNVITGLSIAAPVTPQWDQRLLLGWSRNHRTTHNAGFLSDIDGQSRQAEWLHTFALGPDNLASVGYEYRSALGRYVGSYDERVATNAIYFLDRLAVFDPLFIDAAVRTDDNNRFGRHTTYRIGSSVTPPSSRGTRLFTSYATGFRAPTLDDLFASYGSNPNLKPETSRGYEVGISQRLGNLAVQSAYFNTRYRSLIAADPTAPPFTYFPINIDSAFAKGAEVSTEWTPSPKTTARLSYTYTGTRDSATNAPLAKRPRNKGHMALVFHPDEATDLRVDYRYVGERLDFGGTKLAAYAVTNVVVSKRSGPDTEWFARAENVFDRQYEEVTDYGTAGRSFYAGVTRHF